MLHLQRRLGMQAMVPKTLIERCCLNDSRAETELWIIVKSAAQGPVRSMLRTRDFDIVLVEDVMQEMVLIMAADNHRRLRDFRGESEGQFRAYLRTIAIRLTQDMLRRWERTRKIETQINGEWEERSGGFAAGAITSVVEEVESRMTKSDRKKFRVILYTEGLLPVGDVEALRGVVSSPRTVRRWKLYLFNKYFRR